MRAILSEIHANLEALTAVLADIERRGIRSVFNLGDTLGYGPDPVACLDHAMRMDVVLLGLQDELALYDPDGWSGPPEKHVFWTRKQLEEYEHQVQTGALSTFLRSLPRSYRENDVLHVHGSPRNPTREYVFPEDIYNPRKMGRLGALFEALCFVGHTHMPGVFVHLHGEQWEYRSVEQCADGFEVTGKKLICNVGSAGQPRDGDPRACYVTFDGNRIRFHRVAYDVETTIRKIHAVPEIDNIHGDRLREGR